MESGIDGIESLWSAICRLGPVGMALGRVKRRLKIAKRETETRRRESWREPSRGSGRPKRTSCRGIVFVVFVCVCGSWCCDCSGRW